MPEQKHKTGLSDEDVVLISQRLCLRWKVLQGVGATLITLSIFIEWPALADASLPQTSSFLLVVGVLVLMAGLIGGKWDAGDP